MTLVKRIIEWWKNYAPYEEQPTKEYIKRQIEDNKPGLIQFFQDIYEDMSVDTEEDEKLFKELGSILEELQKI